MRGSVNFRSSSILLLKGWVVIGGRWIEVAGSLLCSDPWGARNPFRCIRLLRPYSFSLACSLSSKPIISSLPDRLARSRGDWPLSVLDLMSAPDSIRSLTIPILLSSIAWCSADLPCQSFALTSTPLTIRNVAISRLPAL